MSRGTTLSILGLYNFDNRVFSEMAFPSGFSEVDKNTVIGNILGECAELEILFPNWDTCRAMIGMWSKINISVWDRIFTAANLEYNPIENYNRTETETITGDLTETHSGNDVNRLSGQDVQAASGSDTLTNSGTDTVVESGADRLSGTRTNTQTNGGTDTSTNSVAAYDSNTLLAHDKSELVHGHTVSDSESVSNTTTYGKQDATSYGHVETTAHGKTETLTHGKTETLTHGEQITHDNETTKESHISGNIGVTTSQQMLEQEIEVAAKLNVMQMIVNSFKERFCILVY